MKALAKALNIRAGEGRLVLLVGLIFLCVQAGQGLGDNAASALFLLRFGVDNLPFMYLLLGGVTFLLTLAYSAGIATATHRGFFASLIVVSIVVLAIERIWLGRPSSLLYPTIWLTTNGMAVILGTFVWNLAGDLSDARQAKRLFPLFTSAGILGGVVGNALTGGIAEAFGTENLLVVSAGLLALALGVTLRVAPPTPAPALARAAGHTVVDGLRGGFEFVRRSRLMQLIASASVLFSILYFSIAFPFNKVAAAAFPGEAQVAGFLGLFNGMATGVTFLIALLVANRLYGRFGIVNSILFLPAAYLIGFLVFAAWYSINGAVIARFSQLVVLGGIGGTAWNALFNVVPSSKRGQVLAFQNGVPAQIGVALSGLLLIVADRALTGRQILLLGSVVTLVCAVVIWRMRHAYGQALLEALRLGRVEVFDSEATGFTGLRMDAAALNVARRAAADPKPRTRALAAQILGKMENPSGASAVQGLLDDPDPEVRASAVRALAQLDPDGWLAHGESALRDPSDVVRLSALAVLGSVKLWPSRSLLETLESLLSAESASARSSALIAIARLGNLERAVSKLREWLAADDPDLTLSALSALAVMPDACSRFSAEDILASLRHEMAAIRIAACYLASHLADPQALPLVARCLEDPSSAVRVAAAESLARAGQMGLALLFQAIEAGSASAKTAALGALKVDSDLDADRLRSIARAEIGRLRDLRSWEVGLPSGGLGLGLLRESLRHQARESEDRLLRLLGLLGNPRAMDQIRRGLRDPGVEARAAALEALDTLGDRLTAHELTTLLEQDSANLEAADVLERLTRDGVCWNRALAIRSIQELRLSQLSPRVAALLADPEVLVRDTAQAAVYSLNEEGSMDTLSTVSTLERVLLLREVPIFSELSPEDLQHVAEIATEQWLPPDSVVLSEGEHGSMMYIIVEGSLQVFREAQGALHVLATRGPGDFVGEMAIIEAEPRLASAKTLVETRLLSIDGMAFKSILRERPDVALSVLRSLSRRLREASA